MSTAWIVSPLPIISAAGASGTAAGQASHVAVGEAADKMGMFWRSPGTIAQIQLDMGSDQMIDTVAMLAVYGAPAGIFSIFYATAAQGNAFGSVGTGAGQFQVISVGTAYAGENALVSGRQASLWGGSAFTARYVTLNISNVASGEFQFSRAVIGRRLPIVRNFSFGAAFGVRDFSTVDFSTRGALLRRSSTKLRTIGLSFPTVYKDELESHFAPFNETAGIDRSVLVVTDPDPHPMRTRRIFFGPMIGDIGAIWRSTAGFECRTNLVSLF